MELPILILPHPPGFQASTGGPLDLAAVGPTPDAATESLRSMIELKLHQGGQIRTLKVSDVDTIQASAKKVGESPLFDEWVREVEEYRRQHNTIPDAE
jgi:hypothetical protein